MMRHLLRGLTATVCLTAMFVSYQAYADDCRAGYPAHWWQEVDRSTAPDWEILPQDAGPCEVVMSKRDRGGLELLSNFAATPFELDGQRYESVEGFWQMMKYPENPSDPRAQFPGIVWQHARPVVAQMIGFPAKEAGNLGSDNMKQMGINWVSYRGQRMVYRTPLKGRHYRLIRRALVAKLRQNPAVRKILIQTGDLALIPDHIQGADVPPAWRYDQIWQELRHSLKKNR